MKFLWFSIQIHIKLIFLLISWDYYWTMLYVFFIRKKGFKLLINFWSQSGDENYVLVMYHKSHKVWHNRLSFMVWNYNKIFIMHHSTDLYVINHLFCRSSSFSIPHICANCGRTMMLSFLKYFACTISLILFYL